MRGNPAGAVPPACSAGNLLSSRACLGARVGRTASPGARPGTWGVTRGEALGLMGAARSRFLATYVCSGRGGRRLVFQGGVSCLKGGARGPGLPLAGLPAHTGWWTCGESNPATPDDKPPSPHQRQAHTRSAPAAAGALSGRPERAEALTPALSRKGRGRRSGLEGLSSGRRRTPSPPPSLPAGRGNRSALEGLLAGGRRTPSPSPSPARGEGAGRRDGGPGGGVGAQRGAGGRVWA